MVDVLVAARGVHFASTASVVGVTLFQYFVTEPAFRAAGAAPSWIRAYREKLRMLLLISLAVAVFSGAAWLIALAMDIGGPDPAAVVSNGTVWLLLTSTQFGHVWLMRLVLAALLFGLARPQGQNWTAVRRWEGLSAILASCLMGALAWAGHAGASSGAKGVMHLTADILHLVAGGAWLGGLVPLWLLFKFAIRQADRSLAPTVEITTHRFSALGVSAVGTLLATGLVNTWMLVGGLTSLLETEYGRLLLLKIALFVAMVITAGINRLRLTSRLPNEGAMRQLALNVLVEIGLGLAILAVVSVLGVLPPAMA
jgi:putative copper resistance protein D